MKVGELARRTGLTVRTLHWYDEVGLVTPAKDPRSGHRRYAPEDVARLQQIVSLRELGLSLDEIRTCMEGPGYSLDRVLRMHRARLRDRILREQRVLERLDAVIARLDAAGSLSVDTLTETVRSIVDLERYFDEEQRATLEARARALGPEGMAEGQRAWVELIGEVEEAVAEGVAPASERGRELARRWRALIEAFTGGDAGLEASVRTLYDDQPGRMASYGISEAMLAFVGEAGDSLSED